MVAEGSESIRLVVGVGALSSVECFDSDSKGGHPVSLIDKSHLPE